MRIDLGAVWIDEDGPVPLIDYGNTFCTFGVTYGISLDGSGHYGLVCRALPDRPRSEWPDVLYDEVEGRATTLGRGAPFSQLLVELRASLDRDRLTANVDALDDLARGWGDERIRETIEAIEAGASEFELLELVEPGSVRAAMASMTGREPVDQWLALAERDPVFNRPLVHAHMQGAPVAAAVLSRPLLFDCDPFDDAEAAALDLHQLRDESSPFWPIASAAAADGDLQQGFMAAARLHADADPLAALGLVANAIELGRDRQRWPDGGKELLAAIAPATHADYQSWLPI